MRHAPALILALAALTLACGGESRPCSCDLPAHCSAGACTTSCSTDGDCGDATLTCQGGTCTARCEGVLCPEGNYCARDTGQCVPDPDRVCKSDADCDDDTLTCQGGTCISRCYGVTCNLDAGEICAPRTGKCVGGRACRADADCQSFGDNVTCQDGLCAGESGAACSAEKPCGAGLDCTGGLGYQICAAPCSQGTDCVTTQTCINDPAAAYNGHCITNLCAPGGGPTQMWQDAAFMGPCDAAGKGDGICLGPISASGVDFGVCSGKGTLASGAACHTGAKNGSGDACLSGFCTASGSTPGVCLDGCSLFDGNSCPDLNAAATACVPIFGVNGLCVPALTPLTTDGGVCMQPDFRPPCVEDLGCIDGTCTAYCDLGATAGKKGSCASGACTQASTGNDHLGVCQ